MEQSAGAGFATATDIAEYLVRKGVPFRSAHEITGRIVRHCIETGRNLEEVDLREYRSFSDVFGKDLYTFISPSRSVTAKRSEGGTSPDMVREQIGRFREMLGKD
jgi:argininosuccinate lyase